MLQAGSTGKVQPQPQPDLEATTSPTKRPHLSNETSAQNDDNKASDNCNNEDGNEDRDGKDQHQDQHQWTIEEEEGRSLSPQDLERVLLNAQASLVCLRAVLFVVSYFTLCFTFFPPVSH